MRKDWALLGIIGLIIVVGLGLFGYLKLSKKQIVANPLPSISVQGVAGTETNGAQPSYFSADAKVAYFYSDFCHWCQKEKTEVLEPLAKEGYKVKPMNVGENADMAKINNITGTPTFVASNGDRLVGFQDKDKLKAFLDAHK